MMIRLMAAILFLCAGFLWGHSKTVQLKRNVDICVQIDELFRFFDMRIRYRGDDLYEICGRLDSRTYDKLEFISTLPVEYSPVIDFHEVWRNEVECQKGLNKEERSLLLRFGEMLGTCDVEGQHISIEAIRSELDILGKYRRNQYRVRGRLYHSIGPMLGIMAGLAVI